MGAIYVSPAGDDSECGRRTESSGLEYMLFTRVVVR